MSVANVDGAWILELQIPDDRAGYVLAAAEESADKLAVSFMLATEPSVTHQGRLDQIAGVSETIDEQGPTTTAIASIDRAAIPQLRPGATVTAKIDCGKRSIGYVWLHDVIDVFRTRVIF
jgi:hypothetical protein